MLFGFTDEAHKPYDNKQAENGAPVLLPWTDVRCLAHNESGGWDEREQGRWDSGSSLKWTGLAVVSLRGICMFKATPQSSRVLSERWLKSTSETSSVEFQIKFRKLDEVKPSLWKFVSGTTV